MSSRPGWAADRTRMPIPAQPVVEGDGSEAEAIDADIRAGGGARQRTVRMPVEMQIATVHARPYTMGVVAHPDALGHPVRSRDDHPGDVEQAVPGQSRADPVVVTSNEEAALSPEADEDGSGIVLAVAVAKVAEVPDDVVGADRGVPVGDQRLDVRLDCGPSCGRSA